MEGHSPPVPFLKMRQRHRPGLRKGVPVRAAIAVFAALLILFAWLHLLLAAQILSIGKQIESRTAELEAVEHRTAIVRLNVARAESPESLRGRAIQAGFEPQTPDYLPLSQQPLEEEADRVPSETAAPARAVQAETSASQVGWLLDAIFHRPQVKQGE